MRERPIAITKILAALLEKDYTESSWAKAHNYKQHHVSYAIHKWSGRQQGNPKGITRQILFELSMTIGRPVSPTINYGEDKDGSISI